jgi:para-nitrobenzyl esterase
MAGQAPAFAVEFLVKRSWILIGLVVVSAALAGSGFWLYLAAPGLDLGDEVVIADVASERLTHYGSIVGFAGPHDSHAWLGIPYAAPPVGDRRWRAPGRPEPWTDTLDALEYGSACPQLGFMMGGVDDVPAGTPTGSEDCLRLNVWAPRFDQQEVPSGEERLPVMLWIHGGSNTIGLAGPAYEGAKLATAHRLVVVSLNYRLGPFGWFGHPAVLRGERDRSLRSGNFGTLDLIAGLQWVRENIQHFGGDPGNVTIFGESAGGTNVVSLLLAPAARGLFHRAIVQSGGTTSTSIANAVHYVDDAEPGDPFSAREVVLNLLIADGSASDRASAKAFAEGLSAEELAGYLRSKPPEAVLSAYQRDPDQLRIHPPRLIRDGVVLPVDDALTVLRDPRRYNAVPIMLGSNRDENKLFMSQDPEYVDRYLGLIYRLKDGDYYDLLARFQSDKWKADGVDQPAEALRAAQGERTYAYRFDWDEESRFLGADFGAILGAAHGLEIPFVFGHFRYGPPRVTGIIFGEENWPGRKYLSDAMMSYWAEFAYTGSPGQGRAHALPEWLPWTDAEDKPDGVGRFVVLDSPTDGGIRMARATISHESVIASVDAEPSLTQLEKCRVFWKLFRRSEGWSEEAYAGMGRIGCREHPSSRFVAEAADG